MPSWKKVLISGSDAALNSLNISAALTASGLIYPTIDGTLGQALVTDGSGHLSFSTISSGGTGASVKLFQTEAATTWSFAHNLNEKFPAVTIYDSNDEVIIPQKIDAIDNNNMLIYFSTPRTGTAAAVVGGSTVSASYSQYAVTSSYADNLIVSGGINPVSYIVFNSSSAAPLQDYMLQANTTDKTLDLRMGNNATLQLGMELYNPPIVNESGGDLTEGTLVMFNPADISQGNRISVVKAVTDGTYPADKIVGVLTEDVAHHQEGFATFFGLVRDLPKTVLQPAGETWAEGDVLYPNPAIAGGLTKIFPPAPNLRITVGTITRINGNNVTITVSFHKRTALKRAHDVNDTTTNSSYGDILVKSGSVWTNTKQLSGSYALTGSLEVQGTVTATSSIQVGDNSATASSTNVGSIRYRTSGNNSYVDMVMQTGASTYEWVNIVQNNW